MLVSYDQTPEHAAQSKSLKPQLLGVRQAMKARCLDTNSAGKLRYNNEAVLQRAKKRLPLQ